MNSDWFVSYGGGSKTILRLFAFHPAGGSASFCRNWCASLPDYIEVVGVQLPGRELRFMEPHLTCVKDVVNALLPELESRLNIPYVVFGHSMGSYIAYELIRKIQERKLRLPRIYIPSGKCAPDHHAPDSFTYDLPVEEFCKRFLEKDYSERAKEILADEELRAIFLPQLKADMQIIETYEYIQGPPLECPIVAFAGLEEVDITQEDLAAWARHSSKGFDYHVFPGDHFFIEKAEPLMLAKLVELLSTRMETV